MTGIQQSSLIYCKMFKWHTNTELHLLLISQMTTNNQITMQFFQKLLQNLRAHLPNNLK